MEGLGGYCRDLGLSSFLCVKWELLECCEWRTDTTDLDLNEITLAAVSGSQWGNRREEQGDQLRCCCREK